jgi:diguanylate cyclase (GGDEF)-like protein/PAS domain S-box-containing protein
MPGVGLHKSDTLTGPLRLGLIAALLFVVGNWLSSQVALQSSGLQALWPANASVFGLMVYRRHSREDLVGIVGAGVIASFVMQLFYGSPALKTLLFPIANGMQWMLAYALLRRTWRTGELLDRVSNVLALFGASATALAVTSNFGALSLFVLRGVPFLTGYFGCFVAGLLGQMLVAPAVMIAARAIAERGAYEIRWSKLAEAFVLLGMVAAITFYVFYVSRLPTTFAIIPFVLLATFRFRTAGAIGAMVIVSAISAYATGTGRGAIAYLLTDPGHRVLMLQAFLAGTFFAALPVAAMLTERDQHAEEARLIADHFRSVVENIGEVIFRIDGSGRWVYLNPSWTLLSGLTVSQSLGRVWTDRFAEEDAPDLVDATAPVLRGELDSLRRVVRLQTSGGPRWVEVFVQVLRDGDGRISGATGTLRDVDDRKRREETVITAKRRAEQRAREATVLASTDELTGIANRRAFMGQLDREIASAIEFNTPLAVAIFDVDHFKAVNDRYGHAVGDRVLQLIARRAGTVVRGGDLVGRIGGEEFGILMPGATAEDAAHVAERLRDVMLESDSEEAALPSVTVSVGIASRERQRDAAALLAAADAALYQAKDAGRNRVKIAA